MLVRCLYWALRVVFLEWCLKAKVYCFVVFKIKHFVAIFLRHKQEKRFNNQTTASLRKVQAKQKTLKLQM